MQLSHSMSLGMPTLLLKSLMESRNIKFKVADDPCLIFESRALNLWSHKVGIIENIRNTSIVAFWVAGLSLNWETIEFPTEVSTFHALTATSQISAFSSNISKTATSFRIAQAWETSSTESISPVSSNQAPPSFEFGLALFWYWLLWGPCAIVYLQLLMALSQHLT